MRWLLVTASVGSLAVSSCASSRDSTGADTTTADAASRPEQEATPEFPTTSPIDRLTLGDGVEACDVAPVESLEDSVTAPVTALGEFDGVRLSVVEYPLPDYEGNPWSQWGQGVVLPDGRFVSAVGDHHGRDGRSWFFEFDPSTGQLARTTEVSDALGHQDGDWGYGKIHAPLLLDACDGIVTSTYWGSRRGLELGGSYNGDHLIRYDPSTREVTSLGVPVPLHGVPSLAISPDRQYVFGEAVDPASEPDSGAFFVADAETGEVVHVDERTDHVGFRDILVTAEGEALYSAGDGRLVGYRADTAVTRDLTGALPGEWLRAASDAHESGTVVAVTRNPDAAFALGPGDEITELGELEGYVASIALSPEGDQAFYVPGAHGDGWRQGTPVIAVDTNSGERRTLIRLNDVIEPTIGVRVGGTYNVVADPSGERLFIGLNGNDPDGKNTFGRVMLAIVEW